MDSDLDPVYMYILDVDRDPMGISDLDPVYMYFWLIWIQYGLNEHYELAL